jgi:hypothetical protein
MRIRKHTMLSQSHGVVALPGGSGTLEELFEAITLKRLGLYVHPIVLVNTRDFFSPLIQLLQQTVAERFMNREHLDMWQVVASPKKCRRARHRAALVGRGPSVRRRTPVRGALSASGGDPPLARSQRIRLLRIYHRHSTTPSSPSTYGVV